VCRSVVLVAYCASMLLLRVALSPSSSCRRCLGVNGHSVAVVIPVVLRYANSSAAGPVFADGGSLALCSVLFLSATVY
jgi:hypothetical protein